MVEDHKSVSCKACAHTQIQSICIEFSHVFSPLFGHLVYGSISIHPSVTPKLFFKIELAVSLPTAYISKLDSILSVMKSHKTQLWDTLLGQQLSLHSTQETQLKKWKKKLVWKRNSYRIYCWREREMENVTLRKTLRLFHLIYAVHRWSCCFCHSNLCTWEMPVFWYCVYLIHYNNMFYYQLSPSDKISTSTDHHFILLTTIYM